VPRRPKDNYYQVNGRPHAGLDDPARFGLTFNKVVELINNKKWRGFYMAWLYAEKKRVAVEKHAYICPVCYSYYPELKDWRAEGICCRKCKVVRVYCSNCRREKQIELETGAFKLCKSCLKLLLDLKSWEEHLNV
jgi:hypothetical protein